MDQLFGLQHRGTVPVSFSPPKLGGVSEGRGGMSIL